ncbi:hypothetical protein Nepgr_032007 [Nepenthes gracilis]|uniref:DUF868 domain-containing protein n=1 Tax=Nepenthes gracilis TaxID=150966 RepID=A0AAD3Y7J5_NEPGR|nr:hypothetical protein Nepgr_032007 [Nepenthes gracilis]
MRSIATCYSEHAVRVSDSYCSGPLNRSYLSPKLIQSIRNAVSLTYKTRLSSQKHLLITVTWCDKLICQGFWINVSEKMSPEFRNSSNSHQLCKIKGTKEFESCNSGIEVYWDLSNAKFEAGPEPISAFYIVVLIDSTICLILGDMEDDPQVKKVTVGLPIVKFSLVYQCENFSGQKTEFSTKAKFCDSGLAHDILVKFGEEDEGPKNPIFSVFIDNKRVIKVMRLQWNFRGNQVTFVDGVLVDVMWDVYGWFAQPSPSAAAVFLFRTRSGLDSRLWLEEKDLAEKNHDKLEFSLLISASKNPG